MRKFRVLVLILLFSGTNLAKGESIGSHGMFLFGENATYASHLPMFHKPHHFQLILEIELTAETEVLEASGFRTLLPQTLDIEAIIDGSLKSFKGTLFSGHFERGGSEIGDVQVNIKQVIFAQKLKAEQKLGSEFLLFGNQGEYYAVHRILGAPSYDAILKVSAPYFLEFDHCLRRVCSDPVRVEHLFQSSFLELDSSQKFESEAPKEGDFLGGYLSLRADVHEVLYVEYDELAQ